MALMIPSGGGSGGDNLSSADEALVFNSGITPGRLIQGPGDQELGIRPGSGQVLALKDGSGVDAVKVASDGTGNLTLKKCVNYDGITLGGKGLAPIVSYSASLASSTDAITVVSRATGGADDELLEVGGTIIVTAWTSGAISFELSYTDARGNLRTFDMRGVDGAGSAVTSLTSTGVLQLHPVIIAVDAATTATLKTNFSGTATADFFGYIKRIS